MQSQYPVHTNAYTSQGLGPSLSASLMLKVQQNSGISRARESKLNPAPDFYSGVRGSKFGFDVQFDVRYQRTPHPKQTSRFRPTIAKLRTVSNAPKLVYALECKANAKQIFAPTKFVYREAVLMSAAKAAAPSRTATSFGLSDLLTQADSSWSQAMAQRGSSGT